MRNTQRFLTLAGMTLAAGAILGMGATAASAAPSADSGTTAVQAPPPGGGGGGGQPGGGGGQPGGGGGQPGGGPAWPGGMGNNNGGGRWHGNFDGHRRNNQWVQSWVVDTFRNKKACNFAGWIGEQRNWWDDSDCYRIGSRNHVRYVLVAHEYGGRRHR
ncbi:hypothetical protein ACFO1B_31130 [Dactylosporangium siamense]|uniref:Uncharacterized protein n=1 Tax=Dactylosporangium siamense TaxID=685454 RepID=A0A919UB57_9ACTN|nr:hypothetical protein [Dactylosporangium siamense]GIG48792.1 hypothetical protein Dsi01nite_068330 [Dactylosporangium siamense]